MSGGKIERFGSEDVSRPRASGSGPKHGIEAEFAVRGDLGLNELGVRGSLRGIVAAGHVDFDIAEAVFGKMVFEKRESAGGGHVRNQAHIDFGDGAVRENSLATGTGIARDQSFNVDGGLGLEKNEGVQPFGVLHPVFDTELFFHRGFAANGGNILNHFNLRGSERRGFIEKAGNGGSVAVGFDEGVESLHEMPGGAIDLRFETGMDVVLGAASPALAGRD